MMMKDNANPVKELNEEYEDRLFKLIMSDVAEAEGMNFHEESQRLNGIPEYNPSSKEIKKFAKALKTNLKARNKRTSRFTIAKKTLAATLAIVVVFLSLTVSVQAFRDRVLNLLINIKPKYTSLQLSGEESPSIDWINAYVPTYMPPGYKVKSTSRTDTTAKIIFSKDDGNSSFVYADYDSTTKVAIDTEGASDIETVKVNGQDATLVIKGSITAITWSIGDHVFIIQGAIDKQEAIKMAESVKFVK